MLRRTLASVFLLTLLLAQAIPAICQIRCDRQMAVSSSTCHAMSMPASTLSVDAPSQATSPCAAHPCATQTAVLIQKPSQPDLSSRVADTPFTLFPALAPSFASLRVTSPPARSILRPPARSASPLKTALRV